MGRWTALLQAETQALAEGGTDKTDDRGVPSVLAGPCSGGVREIEPAPDQAAIRLEDRRARLLRWGWAADDAERLAERLARRDRDGDPRRICPECVHYRPGRCGNHRQADLYGPELGRDLAAMLQRCTGFAPREGKR